MQDDDLRRIEGYQQELRERSDTELRRDLGGWAVGTDRWLLVKDEIDRRRNEKIAEAARATQDKADKRFFWTEARSWFSVVISVAAFAASAWAAFHKK
jgi:negative regulator of sigma E activity